MTGPLAVALVRPGDAPDYAGTAFAVSRRDVLTARHVLVGWDAVDPTQSAVLKFATGAPVGARLQDADTRLDVAWLRLDEELPGDLDPVRFAADDVIGHPGDQAVLHGWPASRIFDDQVETILATLSSLDSGPHGLKLLSIEAGLGTPLQGLSGGPVLIRSAASLGWQGWTAVGIVREGPVNEDGTARSGVVYATSMSDVLGRWPDLELSALPATPLPLAGPIDSFVANHLHMGAADLGRPFGGRDRELTRLQAWLDTPDSPPCCLLLGSSGVGKSALLVRLGQARVDAGRRPEDIVLVPVSIRYDVATKADVLRALVSRLVAAHGGDAAAAAEADPEVLRDRLSTYLRLPAPGADPLLVVVDGLDEAQGWEVAPGWLDPCQLGRGVRILVSARRTYSLPTAMAWRDELGWAAADTIDLELADLDRDGVTAAVASIGPSLDPDLDVEAAGVLLAEVSAGDPLVLGLLLEDWQAAPDRRSWLSSLSSSTPPGFTGYMARWWEDQERQWGEPLARRGDDVRAVFNVLACARGPLPRRRLLEVAAMLGVNSDGARAGLRDLRRWVVDDAGDDTYVLSHPRLAEYRMGQLDEVTEVLALHSGFARTYAADVESWGTAEWQRIDDYAVRHLAGHLEAAGRSDLLDLLLSRGSVVGGRPANGWYSVSTRDGFLDWYEADVERSWRLAAERVDPGVQVRCALYASSLQAIRARIPPTSLCLLHKERLLSHQQTETAIARLRSAPSRARCYELLALDEPEDSAWALAAAGELQAALQVDGGDPHERGEVLTSLITVLPPHLVGACLRAALGLTFESQRSRVLSAASGRIPAAQLESAVALAHSLEDPVREARALVRLVLADDLDPVPVRSTLRRLAEGVDGHLRVGVLCQRARLSDADAASCLAQIRELTLSLGYLSDLAAAVGFIAEVGAAPLPPGFLDELLGRMAMSREEDDAFEVREAHESALIALGPVLSEAQRARCVDTMVDELERSDAAHPMLRSRAREQAPALVPFLSRTRRTQGFADYLDALVYQAGSPLSVLADRPFASHSVGPWHRIAALSALRVLPDELVQDAVGRADRVQSDEGRGDVLAALVPRLPDDERVEVLARELTRLRRVDDRASSDELEAALAPHLPGDARTEAARASAEVALAAGARDHDFRLFARLAPSLKPSCAWERALQEIARMDDRGRDLSLASLAAHLPDEFLAQARSLVPGDHHGLLARAHLLCRLPPDQRPEELDRILTAMPDWWPAEMHDDFVVMLGPIARQLDDDQREAIVGAVTNVAATHPGQAVAATVLLAPALTPPQRAALTTVAEDLDDDLRAGARAVLGQDLGADEWPRLPAQLVEAAIVRGAAWGSLLWSLAPPVDEAAGQRILEAALGVEDDKERAARLTWLLPKLPPGSKARAFEEMLRTCLGSRLALQYGAITFRKNLGRSYLLQRLAEIPDVVAELGGEAGVAAVVQSARDCQHWWP